MEKTFRAIRHHTAEQIFQELDEAVNKCMTPNPKRWDDCQFRKYYEQIKYKYTGK